jgi:hypothetical protein
VTHAWVAMHAASAQSVAPLLSSSTPLVQTSGPVDPLLEADVDEEEEEAEDDALLAELALDEDDEDDVEPLDELVDDDDDEDEEAPPVPVPAPPPPVPWKAPKS